MARTACSKSKISIWWDIENCHVPRNVDPHYIAQNLRSALHHASLNGPITIDLFADTRILEHKTLEALSSTGISINHIPSGNKDAADKAILVAMLFWALDNPPPAHFLLISGDGDFANALHRLRLKGYDILLARPDQPVKPALLGAATSVWYWTNIAKGHIFVSERENVAKGQIPVLKDSKIIYEEASVTSKELVNIELKNKQSPPDSTFSGVSSLPGVSEKSINEAVQKLHKTSLIPESVQESILKPHQVFDFCLQGNNSHQDLAGFDTSLSQGSLIQGVEAETKAESEPRTAASTVEQDVKLPSGRQSCDENYSVNQPMQPGLKIGESSIVECEGHGMPPGHLNKVAPWTCSSVPAVQSNPPGFSQDNCSNYELGLRKVLKTLETLKLDGLIPTLGNLQDCLAYWDKQHGKMDLKQVLDQAVDLKDICKVTVVEGMCTLFLAPSTELWSCYNVSDVAYAFPDELWTSFYQFLCCSQNWQFFVHCQSMYEAAQRLKNIWLSKTFGLAVGEVMQFLNQAIRQRKWLNLGNSSIFSLSIRSEVVLKPSGSDGNQSVRSRVLEAGKCSSPNPNTGMPRAIYSYDTSTKLIIFEQLKTWLVNTVQTTSDYDVSLVPKDFEYATGIHLDLNKLGFTKLQALIEEFDDVVTVKVARRGLKVLCPVPHKSRSSRNRQFKPDTTSLKSDMKLPVVVPSFGAPPQDDDQSYRSQPSAAASKNTSAGKVPTFKDVAKPLPGSVLSQKPGVSSRVGVAAKDVVSRDQPPLLNPANNAGTFVCRPIPPDHKRTLKRLKKWLWQLPNLDEGYNISQVKKDFQQATGIVLDPESLGYAKVIDILRDFPQDFLLVSPRKGLDLLFRNNTSQTMPAMK